MNPSTKHIASTMVGLLFSIAVFAQTQIPNLKITHLTGDFYVFTTYRSFKGKPMSSNGLYFLTSNGAIMVDTPWDTTQFQPLLDSIQMKHHKKVILCIATHSHEDRTGGLEFLRQNGIKTYTTKQTDEICKEHRERRAEFCFAKDTIFKVGNYSFQTFYGGEGHTKDNIVIWFGKDKILYGGCVIKSTEAADLGYIGESNLTAWPHTLEKIKERFLNPKYIVTGHQDWTSLASLDHTLELLRQKNK
jgi:metallo-beta-lactamase class B